MRDLKIGNLLISQKGIVILACLLFVSGIVFGGTIIASYIGGINVLFLLPVLAITWSISIPSLEEEITEHHNQSI